MTPRRTYYDQHTPTETAIVRVRDMVKALGTDPLLAEAVKALSEAFARVADWTDKQAPAVRMADKDASPGTMTTDEKGKVTFALNPHWSAAHKLPEPAYGFYQPIGSSVTVETLREDVPRWQPGFVTFTEENGDKYTPPVRTIETSIPANVVKVVPRTVKRNESVISCLEKMLAVVQKDNITGIGIAVVDAEGFSRTNFEGGENVATLIGAVCRLQKRLLDYQDTI